MLNFNQSPEEEFWKVKMNRMIDEESSKEELRQIAKLLVNIAATRQCVIKGLIKDMTELHWYKSEDAISS